MSSYVVRPTRVDKIRTLGVKCWFVSARNKTTRDEVKTGILVSRRRQTIRKGKTLWTLVRRRPSRKNRNSSRRHVLSNVENLEVFVSQTSVLVVSLDGEHFLSVVHVQVFGYVCFHQIEVVFGRIEP